MDFEQELRGVAKEYADEGYQVVVRPGGGEVPPFAAGAAGVDLIARRGGEGVIVAVARNRSELAGDPDLVRLAGATNAQPGWRFDLVVLGADRPIDRAMREAREPSPEQIAAMLDAAERAADAGDLESGCVRAWAALEAALRRAARGLGLADGRSPTELLGALYANGGLSRDELTALRSSYRVRTEVVHGLVPTRLDPEAVRHAVAAARNLLAADAVPEPVGA